MEAAFPSTPNLFRAAEKRYKAYQGRVTDTRDVFDFRCTPCNSGQRETIFFRPFTMSHYCRNLDANSPDNRSKIISISADSSLNVFSITGYEDGICAFVRCRLFFFFFLTDCWRFQSNFESVLA
jgi:hypothetical protein